MTMHSIGSPPPDDNVEVVEFMPQEESDVEIFGPVEVALPGGYGLSDGTFTRSAIVRELNGYDEEELARSDVKRPVDFLGRVVQLGTKMLGTHPFTPLMLQDLLIGDRDALVLGIRRATYGDTLEYRALECPRCEREFELIVDLVNDIPVKELSSPDERNFTVKLRHGEEAFLSLPTHGDQLRMNESSSRVPEQNSILLTQCIVRIGDNDIRLMQDTAEEVVKKLNMRDRQLIIDELRKRQPGPQFGEVKIDCPSCEYTDKFYVDPIGMFRI